MSTSNGQPLVVLNLENASVRLGQDRQLLKDLARFFFEDAPLLMTAVEDGIRSGDTELVQRSAHSIKGMASHFDAAACMAAAAHVETLANSGESAKLVEVAADLRRQIDEVLKAFQAHSLLE